ncbi:hypothetical protein F4X33_20735 [Candidatus Poribacteria bacterium]|nr:hypothetical protein [Candidatus Poribacteria bacterium]
MFNEKTFRSKSQSFRFGIQTALALNLQEKYGTLILSFGGKVRHHRPVVLPTPYRTGKRKTERTIPVYTTKKVKCDKTPELDMLAHESGRVLSLFNKSEPTRKEAIECGGMRW